LPSSPHWAPTTTTAGMRYSPRPHMRKPPHGRKRGRGLLRL